MISLQRSLGRNSLALLAVLIVCLLPAMLQAQTIKLINTSTVPIGVEPTSSDGPRVYQGKPFLLKPGDKSAGIMLPGMKVVNLRDPMTRRVVGQLPIPAGTEDQDYDLILVMDARGRSTWIIKPSK